MTKQSKKPSAADRPVLGSTERSASERSELARSGGDPNTGRAVTGAGPGANETLERPHHRTFSAEYKLRILAEADALVGQPGAIGALLRREGLYSSHLGKWRSARRSGGLAGLAQKPRGPVPQQATADRNRLARLERENARLQHRLKQAEIIIEFQKKLHDLLGIPLSSPPDHDETLR